MKFNIRLLIIMFSLLLLAASMAKSQSLGEDPNLPDTLVIESVTAFTAGIGVVPIRIINDEVLSAIEITLHHDSPYIVIDSFSFAGGRLAELGLKGFELNSDSTTVSIFAFVGGGDALILIDSSSIGNLYLSWPAGIPAHYANLDTITVTTGPIEKATSFTADGQTESFVPAVRNGGIDISASPFVMDSIWINDTSGYLGETVVVDVNLFNERNVSKVSVALGFGAGELRFDSATFDETRGASALTRKEEKNNSFHQLALTLTWNDAAPLPPGSGLLAHLHFTIAPDAPGIPVPIVAEDYLSFTTTYINLTVADGSQQIIPFFSPGLVQILIPTDVGETDLTLPTQYLLGQNYPNPFNPDTTIPFSLPHPERVKLELFNVLGHQVRTLVDKTLPAGDYEILFDGRNEQGSILASGVYYYRLTAGSVSNSSKMLLLK